MKISKIFKNREHRKVKLMNTPPTLTIFNTGPILPIIYPFLFPLPDYFDANLKHYISFVKLSLCFSKRQTPV